jgi:RNA polymerase subunit RPABC4/transcription elongation factor Spt4
MAYMCKICPSIIDEDDIDLCPTCMHSELKQAGWTVSGKVVSVYTDSGGACFRGPYGAWRELQRRKALVDQSHENLRSYLS